MTSDDSLPEFEPNGPEAIEISSVIPYYPFHGVPRFYDISGFLHSPYHFALCIEGFKRRYMKKLQSFDCIAGLDARGFILGPPLALALKVPFIMIRKKGKLPNSMSSGNSYAKEYESIDSKDGTGKDELCISQTAFEWFGGKDLRKPKVLIIDDLVATGGTLLAACELLKLAGADIYECACVVELKALNGYGKVQEKYGKEVACWSLLDENILTLEGKLT